MKIGYARVSTKEQSFDLQLDALRKAGCKKIYQETVSGAKAARLQLDLMLDNLRAGDVLVIWKLDRLGRSLQHLVELVRGKPHLTTSGGRVHHRPAEELRVEPRQELPDPRNHVSVLRAARPGGLLGGAARARLVVPRDRRGRGDSSRVGRAAAGARRDAVGRPAEERRRI